ncbi:MAG: 2-aminoethylphosphonate--pyruvate transaminase, partial [Rhodospirillaceae bacterium]|nr:2-aminoethylphosphonate--pyruvate transaminase [Rhodospirillaceae bacterium]
DQWAYMERTGQWRFTPPTHVVAAFDRALDQHEAEGGVAARGERYTGNWRILVDGMRALGFHTLLPDDVQAPVIVTFLQPSDPAYDFRTFYAALKRRGFIIYPGKTTEVESFRIGCIGAIGGGEMQRLVKAVAATLKELGIRRLAPAVAEVSP